VAAAGIEEMPMDEINAEVKAARAERRQREARAAALSIREMSKSTTLGGLKLKDLIDEGRS
jgi:hypothetical protein